VVDWIEGCSGWRLEGEIGLARLWLRSQATGGNWKVGKVRVEKLCCFLEIWAADGLRQW
jgi:hypothetical protein